MRIGIIGGVDRGEALYRQLAVRSGFELEFHAGDLSGQRSAALDALVGRSHVVVVVTGVNSHAAVWRTRRQARRLGRRVLFVSHFGMARLTALLRELATEPPCSTSALSAR